MSMIWSELRNALRRLAKRPGYTLLAMLVLAGGLGSALYMLAAINQFVLTPVPFPQPERVVALHFMAPGEDSDFQALSAEQLATLRRESRTLQQVAGFYEATINLRDEQGPQRYEGVVMNAELFEVIGAARPWAARSGPPTTARALPWPSC
jgi:hypothetical protein